jgi:hypothetical protein
MQKTAAALVGIAALTLSVVLGISQCASVPAQPAPQTRMASPLPAATQPPTTGTDGSTWPIQSRMMAPLPVNTEAVLNNPDAGVPMADAGVIAPVLLDTVYSPASKSGMALPPRRQPPPGGGVGNPGQPVPPPAGQ